jgi:hypothetical protein
MWYKGISMKIETYYIVEVMLKQCKAYDGSILTKKGKVGYLSHTEEGGEWPTISGRKTEAVKFDKPPTTAEVAKWDGMPWYCNIDSHKVIEVTEKSFFEKSEKVLDIP